MAALLWTQRQDVRAVFGILAVVVIPAVVTLYTVREPIQPSDNVLNPTPFGYTVSLLIYAVPVAAIHWWFRRRFPEAGGVLRPAWRESRHRLTPTPPQGGASVRVDYRRSAYRWTLLTLIPIGFVLDIVFGYAFLTFANEQATLGIRLPAYSFGQGRFVSHLPVEEFLFYALGFMAILAAYIWCDEYWLQAYNVVDYEQPPDETGTRGLPPFIAQVQLRTPLAISAALVGAALLYKKFGPHDYQAGFPSYFTFLVLVSLFPCILLLKSTRRFVNWRAVSFVVFWVVLTSLIWEATLAVPYEWWGYQPRHMLGLSVDAWYGLPVEAVLLWLSVTFTTVTVYEAFKILNSLRRITHAPVLAAIFGTNLRAWCRESVRS